MNLLEEENGELSIIHNCEGCKKLNVDQVVINDSDDNDVINEDVDFESIDADKCTQLVQNNTGKSIRIDVSSRKRIKHIIIISENRIFEMFIDNIYNSSIQGKLLDDFEDTKVYVYNIKVPLDSKQVGLQIPGSIKSVWIFNIKIFLSEDSNTTKLKSGNFDLSLVNQMLENKHLSKNAENFKNVFQMYQSTNSSSGYGNPPDSVGDSKLPFDMSMLSSGMFGGIPFDMSKLPNQMSNQQSSNNLHNIFPDSQKAPKMEDFLASSLLKNQLDKSRTKNNDISNRKKAPEVDEFLSDPAAFQLLSKSKLKSGLEEEKATNINTNELDANLKEYIDKKFEKLNCDIFTRINSFEEETNRKLDLIIQKLDNR